MYEYTASVLGVMDGDTADFDVDLGMDIHVKTRIRFYGINAPEMHATDPVVRAKAEAAKAYVEQCLPVGAWVKLQTIKDKREKFGRYLAVIMLPDGSNLNDTLVRLGFAVPYMP